MPRARSQHEKALEERLAAKGFPQWQPEYVFHPSRKWPFDFAWPDVRIAAEAEGGVFVQGRHTRGVGFENDCEKYDEAALLGWTVFRFTRKQIDKGYAEDVLRRAFAKRGIDLSECAE